MKLILIKVVYFILFSSYVLAKEYSDDFSLPDDLEFDLYAPEEAIGSGKTEKINTKDFQVSNSNRKSIPILEVEDNFFVADSVENYSTKSISVGLNTTNNLIGKLKIFSKLNVETAFRLNDIGFVDFGGFVIKTSEELQPSIIINLLKVQNSVERFRWSFGIDSLTWGEVDGAAVFDILNPSRTFLEPSLDNIQPKGQWLFRGDLFLDDILFGSFASMDNVRNPNFGTSLSINVEPYKISFYAAILHPKLGIASEEFMLSPSHNYNLVGLSGYRAFNKFLFKVDLAAKLGFKSLSDSIDYQDRYEGAVAVEYSRSESQKFYAHFSSFYWISYLREITSENVFTRTQVNAENNISITYNQTFFNGVLNTSLAMSKGFTNKNFLIGGEMTYQISDSLHAHINTLSIGSNINSKTFSFDRPGIINLGLRKYF